MELLFIRPRWKLEPILLRLLDILWVMLRIVPEPTYSGQEE